MSNISGKAYAWNVVTPINGRLTTIIKKLIFKAADLPVIGPRLLRGLVTLSMIHYARWVILRDTDWPRLSPSQPREQLRYSYMFFFSDFNDTWEEYVDAFSVAIPNGLNLLWWRCVGWPKAVPTGPFHDYISRNQIYTNHFYSAYPLAASNDVKAASRVKAAVVDLATQSAALSPAEFQKQYTALLKARQHDLGHLAKTPIVSLAAKAAAERQRQDAHGTA